MVKGLSEQCAQVASSVYEGVTRLPKHGPARYDQHDHQGVRVDRLLCFRIRAVRGNLTGE